MYCITATHHPNVALGNRLFLKSPFWRLSTETRITPVLFSLLYPKLSCIYVLIIYLVAELI